MERFIILYGRSRLWLDIRNQNPWGMEGPPLIRHRRPGPSGVVAPPKRPGPPVPMRSLKPALDPLGVLKRNRTISESKWIQRPFGWFQDQFSRRFGIQLTDVTEKLKGEVLILVGQGISGSGLRARLSFTVTWDEANKKLAFGIPAQPEFTILKIIHMADLGVTLDEIIPFLKLNSDPAVTGGNAVRGQYGSPAGPGMATRSSSFHSNHPPPLYPAVTCSATAPIPCLRWVGITQGFSYQTRSGKPMSKVGTHAVLAMSLAAGMEFNEYSVTRIKLRFHHPPLGGGGRPESPPISPGHNTYVIAQVPG